MIQKLEYRLARKKERQFFGCGERYPTKEAARADAPLVNKARVTQGCEPVTHILTLPAKGRDDCDPSHFLGTEAL